VNKKKEKQENRKEKRKDLRERTAGQPSQRSTVDMRRGAYRRD
jgi:hypothetical protein